MPFHFFDLFAIIYIGIWIFVGLAVLRESRFQSGLVRLLAIVSVVLGPFGLFAYLGLRYLGQNLKEGWWVGRARQLPPYRSEGRPLL